MDHILYVDVVHSLGPTFAINLCITKICSKNGCYIYDENSAQLELFCLFRLTLVVASKHDPR
jgi:hypothetical protein